MPPYLWPGSFQMSTPLFPIVFDLKLRLTHICIRKGLLCIWFWDPIYFSYHLSSHHSITSQSRSVDNVIKFNTNFRVCLINLQRWDDKHVTTINMLIIETYIIITHSTKKKLFTCLFPSVYLYQLSCWGFFIIKRKKKIIY